ncbi:orotidine-5'-phosphate decarboxylase [Rhodoligotrophos appendicifer]|uniref:orotidine-5'-phosphate decarboxylase n=1 Tax=Rhodoligotrophos appendicifer TaxID=987056 RepID=UPI0011801C8F|nr:orotidine-5'-phosphate decarboxylase [Rhodoligotrophos appendicifer]
MSPFPNPICVAIDTSDLDRAVALARTLKGAVGFLKLGLEFFYAHGASGYEKVAACGTPIFLDLKLHDIPNTVAGGLRSLMKLEPLPAIVNVHAAGGEAMLMAAREVIATIEATRRPKLIAVTILTSLDSGDLETIGFDMRDGADTQTHALGLAAVVAGCGLDGVVCSPREVAAMRAGFGKHFMTVVPGIRPLTSAVADQKRIATPEDTLRAGAHILVIGRPITGSDDPLAAARLIKAEIDSAQELVHGR